MVTHKSLDPDELDRPEWNSLLSNYSKHDIGEAYFQGRVEQIGLQVEHWGIDRRHQDDHLIFDNKMDLRLWEPRDGQDETPREWPAGDFGGRLYAEEGPYEFSIPAIDSETGISVEPTYDENTWELRGVVDVKTKANPDWLGVFNLRHLAHYAQWADHYAVPTFIYMTMVDPDAEQVGERDFLTPVPADWNWELLVDHYDSDTPTSLSYGELKDTARGCPIVERTFRAPDGNLVVEIDDTYKSNWDWFIEQVLGK